MKRILCVDDIQTNLFTLEALFESNFEKEYEILSASSGKAALSILLRETVDLILLDIMMPELDGFETAKLIKKNRKTKDIPIIFLTAKKDEETVTSCYEVGAVDYMSKPFNAKELFARVKFHLDLVESKLVLKQERDLIQNILDTQDNLVIVTNGKKIIKINSSVSRVYGINGIENFIEEYGCVCNTFIEKEGYFSLAEVSDNEFWIDVLQKRLHDDNVVVLVKNRESSKLNSFDVKVKKFDENYILSLTNITYIDSENKEYAHQAYYDSLTNIYNRNRLQELFRLQISKVQEEHTTFSYIMMDIDHFKAVNDKYGHLIGDEVLIKLANLISQNIRDSDIFARWGGEEFVLLLPDVNAKLAEKIVTQLRIKVEEEPFKEIGHITCSFGLTEYIVGDTIKTITKRADDALYAAKAGGRNRVCTR